MAKNPKFGASISDGKKLPREAAAVRTDLRPMWRLSRIDFGGPWCPKAMSQDVLVEITRKLGQFESQTWPEIERHGSHFVAISKLVAPARARLKEIKLDDLDALYSLRFSGKERLWGIRVNDVFSAVWWDPEHRICPAPLKHT